MKAWRPAQADLVRKCKQHKLDQKKPAASAGASSGPSSASASSSGARSAAGASGSGRSPDSGTPKERELVRVFALVKKIINYKKNNACPVLKAPCAVTGEAHPGDEGLLRHPVVPEDRDRRRAQEGVPQAGAAAAPRQEPRRRRGGGLQAVRQGAAHAHAGAQARQLPVGAQAHRTREPVLSRLPPGIFPALSGVRRSERQQQARGVRPARRGGG